jgi:redox-sensitive bicupin YhaK (pirin superfamily)
LRPGETVSIPDAPYVHVYVAKGAALLDEAGVLKEGDAARLTAAGGRALSADATSGAEVLIWEMGQA